MSTKPKVSILCVTYNQEKYIGQTLDSFLMQKTDFPFEVIIHDDASTDKTIDIIRTYAKEHPAVFRPLLEKENQYSQGKDDFVKDMLVMAEGTYIAECEGDDFWTDPEKLQRQVDFLDKHPDYNVCFHPVRVFFENNEEPDSIYPDPDQRRKFTVSELLRGNFIQSNSVVYRRRKSYDDFALKIMPFDWYTHLYHAGDGKIGFINRTMSAYRRHAGGVWWTSYSDQDAVWKKYGMEHLHAYIELLKLLGDHPKDALYIRQCIRTALTKIQALDSSEGTRVFSKVMATYPETVETFIMEKLAELEEKENFLQIQQAETTDLRAQITHYQELIEQKDQLVQSLAHELHMIKSSRLWKARNKVARAMKRKVTNE